MTVLTITLSSKGQVVIPKEVRDALHWEPGTTLTLVAGDSSVVLRECQPRQGGKLADIIGMLRQDAAPLSLPDLCEPVVLEGDQLKDYP